MNEEIKIKFCRVCKSNDFEEIISLGSQYVTNFIDKEEEQVEIPKVPLDLILCKKCRLLQLRHNAPPESMWSEQYWYKSGISTTIKNDLKEIVEKAQKIKKIENQDIVIDIGCNDGTLLEFYSKDIASVGFEPSKNVAEEAKSKGLKIINNFFNSENFKNEFGDKKAKIITAISMFYDLEDPNKFIKEVNEVLDEDGLFIIQQNYLLTMLENNAFDRLTFPAAFFLFIISSASKLLYEL